MHTITLTLDTLVDAYERRPASTLRTRAWEWLAEQTSVQFDRHMLLVPSATHKHVIYRATPSTCNCPAMAHCHHSEAARIVADALAIDAAMDACADADSLSYAPVLAPMSKTKPSAADKAKSYAEMAELFN